MKMQINGVEITPEIAEVMEAWYQDPQESLPENYMKSMLGIIECLCRIMIEPEVLNEKVVKKCLYDALYIKNEFQRLIPKKDTEYE